MPFSYEQVLGSESLTLDLGIPLIQRVSVVRCHSASRITWHSHAGYELLLLSEGATTYEFQDGTTADLTGGQFLIIPPEVVHRGLNDLRTPTSLCGVMIAPTFSNAGQHSPFSLDELAWLQKRFDFAALKPLKMNLVLRSQVKTMRQEIESLSEDSLPRVLRIRLMMCQILFEVATRLDGPTALPPTKMVEHAIQYMQKNLDNPTSMRQLARTVGCSRPKLFQIFKEATGLTPNDYWQRIRIEEAYHRLLHSSDSITKIALDCGFTTSQYFCTVFRKYWGLSPSECRKRPTTLDPSQDRQNVPTVLLQQQMRLAHLHNNEK